jgi:hypothetical protein
MWVRIREVSFPADECDKVIDHVRNTAVARYGGIGYRGFRLLVDRPNGRALEVSYWDSQIAAAPPAALATGGEGTPCAYDIEGVVEERCDHYELSIDAG